jgi:hypothetical protein
VALSKPTISKRRRKKVLDGDQDIADKKRRDKINPISLSLSLSVTRIKYSSPHSVSSHVPLEQCFTARRLGSVNNYSAAAAAAATDFFQGVPAGGDEGSQRQMDR